MNKTRRSGQVAIMLVLIIMVLVTLTTTAVAIAFSTTRDTTALTLGHNALSLADSGAENAILTLLRNPTFTGNQSLTLGDGTATTVVSGTSPKTILSSGVVNSYTRQIQVIVTITNGKLTINSWQEL